MELTIVAICRAKPQKLYILIEKNRRGRGESLTAEVYQVTGWGEGRVYFPTLKKGMRFEKHWRRRFWALSSECHRTNANLVDLGGSRLSYGRCDVNLFCLLFLFGNLHTSHCIFLKKRRMKRLRKKNPCTIGRLLCCMPFCYHIWSKMSPRLPRP